MNIKEIEELSGLTRANIRFYEKEGLVVPVRKDNGYRDYSQENLEELKRIRLFRELEVPIDEIRELQNSPEELEKVMRRHIVKIEQQMKHLQDAIAVCKEIQLTGVSYDNLNVEQYLANLRQLERNLPKVSETISASYQSTDIEQTIPHPVVRYVARSIDLLICQILVMLIWNVLLHQISGNGTVENLVKTFFATLLLLFLEPLCISLFRTTPGKQIFGIRLSNITGERLSYKDALERTRALIWWGLGWNIPFFSLYRLYKSYGQCVENQSMEWDYPYMVDYQIPERTCVIPALQSAFYAVLSFFIIYGINLYEMTPPNKGDLTLEEYVENYNYYVKYYAIKSGNQVDANVGVLLGNDGQVTPVGNNVIQLNAKPDIKYEYTYDENYITSVSFAISTELSGSALFNGYADNMTYSIMAFTAAHSDVKDLLQFSAAENIAFQDYQVTFADVNITCDVEYDESMISILPTNFYGFITEEENVPYSISFQISK